MGQINLESITKTFDDTQVISPLDLTINDGEFVVFVGPSGCGKSTLLRMIAGLEDTTSGEIKIDGKDMSQSPPSERGLAMVFQSYALYPHMTVRKNIAFPLRMAGLDKAAINQKVNQVAETLNLDKYLDRKPSQLSGGQRQRVAIGRAIVREPTAFLFDEPLSNLDASLRVTMRGEIIDLHRQLNTTMIYVTHDQVEAMTMADKIVVLCDGRIEQVGSPMELYSNPHSRFVAEFIGSPKMNFIPGHVLNDKAFAVGIRPEHLTLADTQDSPLHGTVSNTECLGSDTFIRVQTDTAGEINVRVLGETNVQYGDKVYVNALGPKYCFDEQGARLN